MRTIPDWTKLEGLTLLRSILAVQCSQLREDTHVCTFQTQARLQKSKDFIEVSTAFVGLYDSGKLLGVDDDIETTNLCLERTVNIFYQEHKE